MDRCEACPFVYAEVPVSAVGARLRALSPRYAEALREAEREGLARTRPEPATWSALEYACHVRDVLRVQRERLQQALEEERPAFAAMRREERAIEERYNEQDLDTVIDELDQAAHRFADALDGLDESQWQRVGIYRWPEEAERTMAWLARHTLHEGVHHLNDITGGLAELGTADS